MAEEMINNQPMNQAVPPEGDAQVQGVQTDGTTETQEIQQGYSFMQMLTTLPDSIREYLMSPKLDQVRNAIYDELNLEEGDRDIAMFTEFEVFFGDLPIKDYPDALWSRLPWEDSEEQRAKRLATDTLGLIFMPAQAYLGDAVSVLHELGANPQNYPQEQIEVRIITYDKAADNLISSLDLPGLDKNGRRRLKGIIESRLRNVRDDMDTKTYLTKPAKTGGAGLEESQANHVIRFIGDEIVMTKFVDEMPEEAVEQKPAVSTDDIKKRLAGPIEEQKEVASRLERIATESGGNSEYVKEMLNNIMFGAGAESVDGWDVVAVVMMMAKQRMLIPLMSEEERMKEAISTYAEEVGGPSLMKEVESMTAGPAAMNVLLQLLLKQFAGLGPEDSARYGLRIVNMLKKQGETQFADLVAFDMDEAQFVWTNPLGQ
jgi:hypothetical protein